MTNPSQLTATRGNSVFAMKLENLTGTVLEQRYRIGEVLGSGGMGAVFKATHIRLRRDVAVKVLRPKFIDSDEYIKRFLQEAQVASMVRHPNVVELLDYGEVEGGLLYSVMEFLNGRDLEQLLQAQPEGRLPWGGASRLLVQIASGLHAVHEQGVVHRDVKPANCFLADGGEVVKILDFGVARFEDPDQDQQLTATGNLVGTPKYMAPELVRHSHQTSPRSDIYSLGVLAYRILTGRVPLHGRVVL